MADPRIIPPLTVNDALFDAAVRHAILVERLKASEVRQIIAFLNSQVFPDVIRQIFRLDVVRQSTLRRRLTQVLIEIAAILRLGGTRARRQLEGDLRLFGITEADFQVAALRRTLPAGLGLEVATASLPAIRAIVSQPMQGFTLTQWFASLSRRAALNVQQQLNIGIAAGETVDQLARRVRGTRRLGFRDGILETTRRQAQAIVRTGVNHVSTQARELVYLENTDLVKAVQIVATLDSRTTFICQGLDGQVFPVGEGPRPPFHVSCRTTTAPVLRSLQELGIDPALVPASTRASMNGQVPESQSFAQWLRRQPNSVQNEALGPTRARLFRGNRVTIDKFTDPQHRPLTLEELRIAEDL